MKQSLIDIIRYQQPAPVSPRACRSCSTFAAEVVVPSGEGGEGATLLCWLCAHYVAEHGISLEHAADAPRCDCARDEIYPCSPASLLRSSPLPPQSPLAKHGVDERVAEWTAALKR